MGKLSGSVVPNLVNSSGIDDEGAEVESEQPSEEEDWSEEEQNGEGELSEEELEEEEEPNEEEKPFRPSKHEPSEEEPIEEVTEEEPSDQEQSEEDRAEGPIAQLFPNDDEIEGNQLNSAPSNLEKRRLADALSVHAQKRWKEDQDSKPDSYSDSFSTCTMDKPKDTNNENTMMEEESGKKRRSRWETEPGHDGVTVDVGDAARKKRKTRWASDDAQLKMLGPLKLPDFANGLAPESFPDPEIQKLYVQLLGINQKLKAQVFVDDRPKMERSPSPPPIYNSLGIQINTREARLHAKFIKRKQKIISKLIKKNPTFKPPSDSKPSKLYKKLYVPVQQYPGYNFVGLILGPRGHTQKRMEKETGAKIHLRGKGSSKEGKSLQHKDTKPDPSENEDLHVCIEAGTQKSLDAAVEMVEKLLVPVEEGLNEHKRAQLRELAKLNEKLKGENSTGFQRSTLETSASCDVCGGASHVTAACPLIAPTPGIGTNDGQLSFPTEFGGSAISPFSGAQIPSSTAPWIASHALSTGEGKPSKEIDEANLFVGYLPQSVTVDKLRELFAPFGPISEAKVIKDKTTGLSKGYGFIKYTDRIFAAEAVARMNRYKIDGKILAVRVGGRPPSAVNTNMGPPNFTYLPPYPGPAAVARGNPAEVGWPGPPGSMLTEPYASFPKNSDFISHTDPVNRRSAAPFEASGQIRGPPSLISGAITSSKELEKFPGYQKSIDLGNHVNQSTPFSRFPSLQVRQTRSFYSHQTSYIYPTPPF